MIRRLCGSGSWLSAFKGAAVYAVFGVLWIYFSDTILASFIRDPGLLTFFRSCMGWLFVVFTALFVFCLLRRHGLEVERSHEDLEKSEASLDILFRVLPIGVGTAKGRFLVMVNDSLCEMTGYSRDEIVGHETRRLYVDDAEFERVGKVLYRDTARKGRCLLEARWRHKDGHEMDVLFGAAVAHEGAAATDIVFSVMDITEQREREALYGLLFEGAHDALMLMDRRVFLDCNPRALEMFGVDRLQLLKASPLDFSPRLQPDGRKSSLAATERIAAALAGEPQVFEWRHLRGDGTPFDTEISLNHIAMRGGGYLLSIARDITERKQTLEALKKSEDYLASIFRAAPIGIAVVDNRVLVDVNDRFCDIFGYDRRELLGRDSRMLYVSEEEYLRCGREYYRCLDTDGHCSVSAHGVRKDGRDIHMLANASMLSSDSGGTAVTFCVLDITDRKLAEERLQQSEERYRELFQSSHLGIFLADDEPRIFDANPRATWITGFSRDELCAFHATDIVHPDSLREASLEEVTDRAADGPIVYERLYRSKGGGAVPVEVNLIVSPVNGYHTVMFQDITARKQAEAKLNESREHLARIIEHSPVGISLMSMDYRYLQVNPAYCRFVGYGEEELLHRSLSDLTHPDDIEDNLRRQRALASGEVRSTQFEKRFVHKDGVIKHALLTVTVISAEDEERLFLAQVMDITDRKRDEEELRRYQDELEHMVRGRTEELSVTVEELRRRNHESETMSRLGDLLQVCETEEESYGIVTALCGQVFPSYSGFLGVYDEDTESVRAVAGFGGCEPEDVDFVRNDCWALRRGGSHLVVDPDVDPVCPHAEGLRGSSSLCVPVGAKGEFMGLLHLVWDRVGFTEGCRGDMEATMVLAKRVAELYALSLSNIRLRARLHRQSIRDPLTGLYNRRHMEDVLRREISRARRKGGGVGVVMFDVDHFKRFNDTHGHDAGDEVLRRLGLFLNDLTRGEDVACRYGGEELLVILPDCSREDAAVRAEDFRKGVEALVVAHAGLELRVTVSIGVAHYPRHGESADSVVLAADGALYKAKEGGRNRVVAA